MKFKHILLINLLVLPLALLLLTGNIDQLWQFVAQWKLTTPLLLVLVYTAVYCLFKAAMALFQYISYRRLH